MPDAAGLGRSLRQARMERGTSQQAAAGALGLPRTAITNIESGIRGVSDAELDGLARLYNVSRESLLRIESASDADKLAVVLPRALPEVGQEEFRDTVRPILTLLEKGWSLRKKLGQSLYSTVPTYPAQCRNTIDALRQAEDVSILERSRLKLGSSPLGNIAQMLISQGIWAAVAHMRSNALSGIFIDHPTTGLAIIISEQHNAERQRFSYVHEYAHALFDRGETARISRSADSGSLSEKRANSFAAAFLMPAEGVADFLRQAHKGDGARYQEHVFDMFSNPSAVEVRKPSGSQRITFHDVALVARHFGVSYEAATWRLKNLNHIRMQDVTQLLSQKSSADNFIALVAPPRQASEAPLGELRMQIATLALEAHRRKVVSDAFFAEIMADLDLRQRALQGLD